MAELQQQILSYLPPAVRNLLEGSSRRELLKGIDATLLVFDDRVFHVESRSWADLPANRKGVQADEQILDAPALAAACSQLLPEQQKEHSVLLLLPPVEFVSTTQAVPGIARESLVSALRLQSEMLLPAYEPPLSLAVNPISVDSGNEHTALWLPQNRLMELFAALEARNIFLAAVKPRLLNVRCDEEKICVVDYDKFGATAATNNDGVVQEWLHMSNLDFEQQEFSDQWNQSLNSNSAKVLEFRDGNSYLEYLDNNASLEYSFFPSGALHARRKVETGRKAMLAAAAVAILLFFSAIPFLIQSIEFRTAAARLAANREMSMDARQDQTAVVNFENQWGLINDFPRQSVREAMFTLQNVLSPERLSSMELSEGLIKIQGTSTDPQAILQRLEQDPMFTEVIFSRATNNTRYYIDLRLATVNFDAYMVRYFPDE